MSVRANNPVEFRNRDAKCSFCGSEDWRGEWMGYVTIYACRECAEERLPRLIADAVWHFAADAQMSSMEQALDRVRAEFWRAVAINATRDRQPITHVFESDKPVF